MTEISSTGSSGVTSSDDGDDDDDSSGGGVISDDALSGLNDTLGGITDTLEGNIEGYDPSDSMLDYLKMSQEAQQMSILYMTELNIEKTVNTCLMNAANDIKFPE